MILFVLVIQTLDRSIEKFGKLSKNHCFGNSYLKFYNLEKVLYIIKDFSIHRKIADFKRFFFFKFNETIVLSWYAKGYFQGKSCAFRNSFNYSHQHDLTCLLTHIAASFFFNQLSFYKITITGSTGRVSLTISSYAETPKTFLPFTRILKPSQ